MNELGLSFFVLQFFFLSFATKSKTKISQKNKLNFASSSSSSSSDDEDKKAGNRMENVPGSFGTVVSFALRFGQTVLSVASLIIMCFGERYFDLTTFFYLATVMSMVTSWSFSFALIDTYSVLVKQIPQEPIVLCLIIPGDFVMSFLSLSGACAVASVTEQLLSLREQICDGDHCNKYQVSALLALMSWFLLLASALFNLWILPSLYY